MRFRPSARVWLVRPARRRAMALLLVMIGLVVCTILTTGFLATQGTSLGIARNERDTSKSHDLAQTGIDMCYWLMRNRADWREGMTPGSRWLNNVPVGDGTVTVTVDKEFPGIFASVSGTFQAAASSGAAPYVVLGSAVSPSTVVGKIGSTDITAGVSGTIARIFLLDGQFASVNQTLFLVKPPAGGSFADDPTQGVTLTSVGNFDNRAFTLLATIHPTGGGTVFKSGNFIGGNVALGSDLLNAAVLDSYNSSVAAYNPAAPGSNADIGSSSLANGALTINFPSVYRGTYIAAPLAVLNNILNLLGGALAPASTSNALEARTPGTVYFPNTSGLGANRGNISRSSSSTLDTPGLYDNLTVSNATVSIITSGTYSFNNITISNTAAAALSIPDGKVVTLIVRGTLSLTNSKINLNNSGVLSLYATSNVTLNNASITNSNGSTARFILFGGPGGGLITLSNTGATVYGAVVAPQHDVTLQTNSPKLFGAVMAKSLTLKNTAAFHFDEALRSLKIRNLTGGSASPGTADYRISIIGGTGIQR
jgi:hypothetical protein